MTRDELFLRMFQLSDQEKTLY